MQVRENNTLVNPIDGLSPINRPLEFLRTSQTDTILPSVSDLVDLNGLYDAMRLHRHQGIKAANSTIGSLQILQQQHLDRILLKKQPFYYNPFHNQRSTIAATDPSVPLYVVTAAKAVHKPDEKRLHSSNQKQLETGALVEKKIFHNTPFPEYGKQNGNRTSNNSNNYETVGYSGIRGVTVSTSAQPIPVVTDKRKWLIPCYTHHVDMELHYRRIIFRGTQPQLNNIYTNALHQQTDTNNAYHKPMCDLLETGFTSSQRAKSSEWFCKPLVVRETFFAGTWKQTLIKFSSGMNSSA